MASLLSESLQAAVRKQSKKQSHGHKHSDTKNGRGVAGRPSSERKRIYALRTGYIQVELVQIKSGRDEFQGLNGFGAVDKTILPNASLASKQDSQRPGRSSPMRG